MSTSSINNETAIKNDVIKQISNRDKLYIVKNFANIQRKIALVLGLHTKTPSDFLEKFNTENHDIQELFDETIQLINTLGKDEYPDKLGKTLNEVLEKDSHVTTILLKNYKYMEIIKEFNENQDDFSETYKEYLTYIFRLMIKNIAETSQTISELANKIPTQRILDLVDTNFILSERYILKSFEVYEDVKIYYKEYLTEKIKYEKYIVDNFNKLTDKHINDEITEKYIKYKEDKRKIVNTDIYKKLTEQCEIMGFTYNNLKCYNFELKLRSKNDEYDKVIQFINEKLEIINKRTIELTKLFQNIIKVLE